MTLVFFYNIFFSCNLIFCFHLSKLEEIKFEINASMWLCVYFFIIIMQFKLRLLTFQETSRALT
jgi:hypothetical protein